MPSLNNLGKLTKKNKIQPSRRERQPPAHNPQENLQMSNITGFLLMKICDTFDIAIEDFLRDIYKEEEATHAKT